MVTTNFFTGVSGLRGRCDRGRIAPRPPLAMPRMTGAARRAGRSRATFALAFGIVTAAKANAGIGSQPLRRVEPHAEWQRAQSNALAKCALMRYMFPEFWKDCGGSVAANQTTLMTANEAASVTGVPLRQVHRIIDAGLMGGAVKRRDNARLLASKALVGLKLAHETADVLTLRSRRAVVATSIRLPRQSMIRTDLVVIDARPAARAVRSGLSQLSKARGNVSSAPDVLGGTPVFKGTRIPVHDVADMLANGDRPAAIMKAFPQLDEDKIRLAAIYALAYPQRGRPRTKPRRSRPPKASETLAFDDFARA